MFFLYGKLDQVIHMIQMSSKSNLSKYLVRCCGVVHRV